MGLQAVDSHLPQVEHAPLKKGKCLMLRNYFCALGAEFQLARVVEVRLVDRLGDQGC